MSKRLISSILVGAAAVAVVACGGSSQNASASAGDEASSETDAAGDAAADAASGDNAEAAALNAPNQADLEAARAANLEKANAFLAENAARDGVVVTESGLQYEVVAEGPEDGASPTPQDLVDVHYVGTLINGETFDSSRARGAPARFPLGRVIPGWIEGLQLMSAGDRYRLYVPPQLAYGETGTPGGPIGPNEALVFDVELLKVASPAGNLEAAKAFLDENGKKDGVTTTGSGLQYEVLSEGEQAGAKPTKDNVVRVQYEGRLTDGTVFDSSYERGQPAEFPLGGVIAGWTEGLQLMEEGDKFRFYIPPELAYGERGAPGGKIGPNEALVFDVELLEVKK